MKPFVPPSSQSPNGRQGKRPMSATDRRASISNQHLALTLRVRLDSIGRDERYQIGKTARRISDLQAEIKQQVESDAQLVRRSPACAPSSAYWTNGLPSTAGSTFRPNVEPSQQIPSWKRFKHNERPTTAPAQCNSSEESQSTVQSYRRCFACTRQMYRRPNYSRAPPSARFFSHKETRKEHHAAPKMVRDAWLAREKYLSRHLD